MRVICAAKLLIVAEGHALILRNSPTHPRDPHGQDLPGGKVEKDESIEEGLAREVEEESGIAIDLGDVQLIYTETEVFERIETAYADHVYLLIIDERPKIQVSWEHESYEWLPVDEVNGLPKIYQRGIDFARHYKLL